MLNALVREMMQWVKSCKTNRTKEELKDSTEISINISAQNMNYFLGSSNVEPKYSHRSLMMLRIASECILIDPSLR